MNGEIRYAPLKVWNVIEEGITLDKFIEWICLFLLVNIQSYSMPLMFRPLYDRCTPQFTVFALTVALKLRSSNVHLGYGNTHFWPRRFLSKLLSSKVKANKTTVLKLSATDQAILAFDMNAWGNMNNSLIIQSEVAHIDSLHRVALHLRPVQLEFIGLMHLGKCGATDFFYLLRINTIELSGMMKWSI